MQACKDYDTEEGRGRTSKACPKISAGLHGEQVHEARTTMSQPIMTD